MKEYKGLWIEARLMQVRETSGEKVQIPAHVLTACADMATLAQESFVVLTLNTKNGLIGRHLVTLGLVDSSVVHARETFRPAIMDGAFAVVLVHNHPSGDTAPSLEDLRMTKQLVEAGKVLDLRVMDHVIIGRRDGSPACLSMREDGLVNFS